MVLLRLVVKDTPRSGRPIDEKIDKIIELTVSKVQELSIAQKPVRNHFNKAGYNKKLEVCIPHG